MKKNYILHKWLNNEPLTDDEKQQLNDSPEFASYIKIAEATSTFTTPEVNSEANFNAIKQKIVQEQTQSTKGNLFRNFIKIAAVFALVFIGYQFLTSRSTTITTQVAQKETIVLPDDSEVLLNAQSQITYNKKQWHKTRALTLQGEAYFKVTKGQKFSVKTPLGTVSVLGTHFNVYARENTFNVVCYEGLVRVALTDTVVNLPAGNTLQSQNGKILGLAKTSRTSPEWVSLQESSFENALLTDVIKELERQYKIKIIVTPNTLLNKRFTGSFTHTNLDIALQTVCKPLQLKYTINKDKVTIYEK